jgi:hypothetical protein
MKRPIIAAAVEEACGKRDGNGEEDQESCGNVATSARRGLQVVIKILHNGYSAPFLVIN